MITVKSFSVGDGDMFYIDHGADCFTVIDCFVDGVKCEVDDDRRKAIIREISTLSGRKSISRFISTHPDEDHIGGLSQVIKAINTTNFYCVRNAAIKKDEESESFAFYRGIRDGAHAFYVSAGCKRKWLNISDADEDEDHGCSGINFLWPDPSNAEFKKAQEAVANGEGFNNISPIFTYSIAGNATFMWMGDIEQDFLEKIECYIKWPHVDVLFAPHHGRESGKVPSDVLKTLNPRLVVIGEAPSENLDYYEGYSTLTQLSAKDITFRCEDKKVRVYSSNQNYAPSDNVLHNDGLPNLGADYYIGSLYL